MSRGLGDVYKRQVYEVEMADGRSLLLPAIKQCILNVDVENGMMQVHVLEGLLDL